MAVVAIDMRRRFGAGNARAELESYGFTQEPALQPLAAIGAAVPGAPGEVFTGFPASPAPSTSGM